MYLHFHDTTMSELSLCLPPVTEYKNQPFFCRNIRDYAIVIVLGLTRAGVKV